MRKASLDWKLRLIIPLLFSIGAVMFIISISIGKSPRGLLETEIILPNSEELVNMETFLSNADFRKPSIPEDIISKAETVKVDGRYINVKGVDLFYREAFSPPTVENTNQTIILLHGQAFKSETWLNLKTINILAAMGHRVIAVDLPGYGETKSSFDGDKASFLDKLISALKMANVVIVSPSMSGSYSVPFLVNYGKQIIGFVPVAPVSTELLIDKVSTIKVPTMIIYGELDTGLGIKSLQNLQHLPSSKSFMLPNAKHPAYLDQPALFHSLLYHFMKYLKV